MNEKARVDVEMREPVLGISDRMRQDCACPEAIGLDPLRLHCRLHRIEAERADGIDPEAVRIPFYRRITGMVGGDRRRPASSNRTASRTVPVGGPVALGILARDRQLE